MGDPRQLSRRSIFVLSLLLLVFCILCGVIIMNSKLDFRLKKDKVSRVIKKPNHNARFREASRDTFISKQFVCEVKCTEHCSCILIFALFWKILAQMLQSYIIFCVCGSVIFAGEVASDLLMIHRVNIILQISLS